MADKKISQLNTATTIYDADDLPVVQDGETKQANASTVKAYVKDGLSKSDVGLGNVDNTSDANKPVSTATQTALDSKQATTAKNAANGYAGLDADAKLPTSLLPALAISEYLGSVANQAARLALAGQKGDWCSQVSDGKVYVISGDDPTDNASWTALTYPVTPGITLNGTSIAPGDTATISAATTNTLTIGTGLSGTSFNGSSAATIAIDSTVVTLTGTQTLTGKTLTSPTINGGTVNNVAIGGTTPAAGNFTTLGATGNTTLGDAAGDTLTINAGTTTFTQGTANGVLYLNGSKVATSNNALTFDGNSFNLVSAGIYPIISVAPTGNNAIFGYRLNAAAGNGRDWRLEQGRSAAGELNFSDLTSNAIRYAITSDGASIWNVGAGTGSEQMRLTSTGLGIGTSSPGYKLDVNGTAHAIVGNGTAAFLQSGASGSYTCLALGRSSQEIFISIAGATNNFITGSAAGDLTINNNTGNVLITAGGSATQLYLNTSGNLGLGVTPSAWAANNQAIEGPYGAVSLGTGLGTSLSANAYYNGGWKYKSSGTTARALVMDSSSFQWYTAPTGTAGNPITFTTAMTLDASGNLLVGGTSTGYGGKIQCQTSYIRSLNGQSTQNLGYVASDGVGNEWHFGREGVSNGYFYVVRQTGVGMYMNTNAWVATSDSRAKKNVQNLESSLDKVIALRPVRFDWISDDTQDVGFIAQEVLPLIPEAVDVQEDPEAMMGISKERMIPFLVKAIQELHAEIETLKQRTN